MSSSSLPAYQHDELFHLGRQIRPHHNPIRHAPPALGIAVGTLVQRPPFAKHGDGLVTGLRPGAAPLDSDPAEAHLPGVNRRRIEGVQRGLPLLHLRRLHRHTLRRQSAGGAARGRRPLGPADAADRPGVQLLREHVRAPARGGAYPQGPHLHARDRGPLRRTSQRRNRVCPGRRGRIRSDRRIDHGDLRGEGRARSRSRSSSARSASGASCRRPSALSLGKTVTAEMVAAAVSLNAGRRRHPDSPAPGGLGRPAVPHGGAQRTGPPWSGRGST